MKLIDTTKELEVAGNILKKQKIIAIDCEFIREKTYFPIPCLIQIGYEDQVLLIDPLAKDMDLSSFFAILKNKKILKVFHSGRQDIEILYNLSGFVPSPVFDTQIAAEACGFGECVSYENLVKAYCDVELDKSCRLTNWQIRPLSEDQLEYAAGDVTYLLNCYYKLTSYLKEHNRESWIKEEMADITEISHYKINPEDAWLKVRHNGHSAPFLNALKALACWREKRAMTQNISRQNIVKDEILVNIASAFPKTMEEIKQVRSIRSDIAKGILAQEMIDVLVELDKNGFDRSLGKTNHFKEINLSSNQMSLYEVLKLLLKIKSNEHGVVSHLITTEKNLREYVKNPKAKNMILTGWRYEIFGAVAEEFRKGKATLSYNPAKHNIEIKEI